jgi:membrane-associated phospholipid phosphatase
VRRVSVLGPWLLSAALCAVVVLLSMAWVDRPVADWVQAHLGGTAPFRLTSRALDLLPLALLPLLAGQLTMGAWALAGRDLPAWTRVPALCSWSAVLGLSAVVILKHLIGRSWAVLYVTERTYGFHPFHGVGAYEAFPSGTTTVAGAVLGVLSIRAPRLRAACGAAVAVVAAGLVLTNSHWVADVLAGAFLGAIIAAMTVRLLDRDAPAGETGHG